ncbi:hypothetical protein D9M72_608740 [compost metagenome]
MIDPALRPWLRIDEAPTKASGKFDTKMAASSARPPDPSSKEMPSATFSGTPSKVTAASNAMPAAPRVEAEVAALSDAAASVSSFGLPCTSSAGLDFDVRPGWARRSRKALSAVNTMAPARSPTAARTIPPCW